MSGSKTIIAAILAPVVFPVFVLADAGLSGIVEALRSLSVTEAIMLISFPATAAVTVFTIGRWLGSFVNEVRSNHVKLDHQVNRTRRRVAVNDAKTRAWFRVLIGHVAPDLPFVDVEDAERAEIEKLSADDDFADVPQGEAAA